MSTPLCADRCQMVADLVAENARLRGLDERSGRISLGLTPVYVPPIPLHECAGCGAEYTSGIAAAACDDSHD